ncbi:hypothetical protein AN189_18090 [Loktanella sp. 3ANDIMAR09]|uniref:DUF3168 domain-containing protein n=1 Tax=Loktanella sp. 3ANDIMAR09 TaxID=1225657 RepID=UPI0006FDAFED|nr:DUF3168 domain-containing protein [Loktanella sp. 3ANDIMAR09]KQI66966.1 hypothetical protein AN189_18090 [Loktanella sp. 3ANDIMAR09]
MEEELRALLLGDAGVAGFVGRRVNFVRHPQGLPFPAIVLNVVGSIEPVDMDGAIGAGTGRVQVDCYADDFTDAKHLSRAVLALLNGYDGQRLMSLAHAGSRDGSEAGAAGATGPFRVSMDFLTAFTTGE